MTAKTAADLWRASKPKLTTAADLYRASLPKLKHAADLYLPARAVNTAATLALLFAATASFAAAIGVLI